MGTHEEIQRLKNDIVNLTRDKNKISLDLQQTINEKVADYIRKDEELQQCNEAINSANNFLAHTKTMTNINLGKCRYLKSFK